MSFLQWFNTYAMRLFLPYNVFFDWVSHKLTNGGEDWVLTATDFNIRFLEAPTVMNMLMLDWVMLVPITAQAPRDSHSRQFIRYDELL